MENIINWFKKNFSFVLLMILTTLSFTSLLKSGYFPMHDDQQAVRLLEIDKCVKDKQFPCRWAPDLGYGYGYPQFNYYGPLPYFVMEGFHLIGFNFLDSVKIGFIFAILLGSIGMYLLGRLLWGKWGGFLSGLIYTFAPYHAMDIFVRGAMGEFWALSLLPFILWSIGTGNWIVLAISFASLILSHNITTFLFSPVLLLWMVINKKGLKGVVLGGLLSSFFLLPVIFEKNLVHIETLTQGYFNYLAHFVSLKQLLFSNFWAYGTSELGPYDNISFAVGILIWSLPMVCLFLAYKTKNNNLKKILSITLLAFFYLFLTHQKSTFVWKIFPFLEIVQFPWRFIGIAVFLLSLASGSLVVLAKKQNITILLFIISIFTILLNTSFFKPRLWLNITDQEKFSGKSWNMQITSSIFDYLPIYAKHPPTIEAPDNLILVNGKIESNLVEKGTNWQKWNLEVISDRAEIRMPTLYFPDWQVFVDGKKTKINYNNEIGLITFEAEKGSHEIYAVFKNTPIRTIGNTLSLITLVVLIYFIFK